MRTEFLPLSRPSIGPEEVAEVIDSLQSGWLTTGPKVQRFEQLLAGRLGVRHVVAMNSGTAALHVALIALDLQPRTEVITSPITFAATVNMILAVGARPVLVDVDPDTLNLQPEQVADALTPATRAIMPVHFAGLPCDMDGLADVAFRHNLTIIEDAAHAIGASYHGRPIGSLSPATAFSFHPIKNITTGEGGALCTDDDELARRAQVLRFHGIEKDAWKRYDARGTPHYDVTALGYKYNMLDLQAALGLHQIRRLDDFITRRTQIASQYREGLGDLEALALPPEAPTDQVHAWHLYPVKVLPERLGLTRDEFMMALKDRNIGTGLHFRAIHEHTHFAQTLKIPTGSLAVAEWASARLVSLPLFPAMSDTDVADVIEAVREICHTSKNLQGTDTAVDEPAGAAVPV